MDYPFSGILVRYLFEQGQSTQFPEICPAEAVFAPLEASLAPESLVPPAVTDDPMPLNAPLQAPNERTAEVRDELHVNLWEVGRETVLDLGIMIHDWREMSAVQIDLPWSPSESDITDLGSRLNSEKMVAAIFNEVVQYSGCADEAYAEISFRRASSTASASSPGQTTGHFNLIRLTRKAFSITPIPSADGTISSQLRVALPNDLKSIATANIPRRIYLRFRIRAIPKEVYSSVFRQRDRNLLSSSSETRIVDFRINVRRGVPDEILANAENVAFPQFKKIHFFLTVDRTQTCDFESKDFAGCRSLVDEDEWTEYIRSRSSLGIDLPASVKNYLGYQWTAKSNPKHYKDDAARGVKDLVVLGRFSRNRSNAFHIVRFVLLGLIFGMVGNALWDVIRPTHPATELSSRVMAQTASLELIGISLVVALVLMFFQLEPIGSIFERLCRWTLRNARRSFRSLANMSR